MYPIFYTHHVLYIDKNKKPSFRGKHVKQMTLYDSAFVYRQKIFNFRCKIW